MPTSLESAVDQWASELRTETPWEFTWNSLLPDYSGKSLLGWFQNTRLKLTRYDL